MLSQGIYSIVLLIFSNIFMTFAWYGHLKMREEFSWFASLVCFTAADRGDCVQLGHCFF